MNSSNQANRLLTLLKEFSGGEIKKFRNFLRNNTDKNATIRIDLLNELLKIVRNKSVFDEKAETRIFRKAHKIQNGKKLLDTKERAVFLEHFRAIYAAAKEFLIKEELSTNLACEVEVFSKAMLAKSQIKTTKTYLEQIAKTINTPTPTKLEDYAAAFKLEEARLHSLLKEGFILKENNFEALNAKLDAYYLLYKVRLYLTMQSVQSITSEKFSFNDTLLAPLLALHPTDSLIQIYHLCYSIQAQIKNKGTEEKVKQLLDLLRSNKATISKNDLTSFYTVICNFYVFQDKQKDRTAREKLLAIYKEIEPQGLLLDKKINQYGKLINIISLSCRANDFAWASSIFETYAPMLRKQEQDSFKNLFYGIRAFYKQEYESAKQYFTGINTSELNANIMYRTFLVKALFEIDKAYRETTIITFKTQEKFFTENKKIGAATKEGFKNFVTILRKLYRAYHQGKYESQRLDKMTKIHTELTKQQLNSDTEWLLQKMTYLKEKGY